MVTSDQIVAAARGWIGTPYHHQGRSAFGMDCVGLLVMVGRQCGVFPRGFDYADYGRSPTGQLDALLARHLERVADPVPGVVVSIRWWKQSHHVGIVAEHGGVLTMVHALQQLGGVREQRMDERMRKRITGCYAFPGVVS